jgi:hypothetical protein
MPPAYVHLLAAKDLIDRRYAEPLDTAALARAAHASEYHFIRSFRQVFGETPHQYLQRRRIERAKELPARHRRDGHPGLPRGRLPSLGLLQRRLPPAGGEPPSAYRARPPRRSRRPRCPPASR